MRIPAALSSLAVRLGLAMSLLSTTVFCYQLFKVPSAMAGTLYLRQRGEKIFC